MLHHHLQDLNRVRIFCSSLNPSINAKILKLISGLCTCYTYNIFNWTKYNEKYNMKIIPTGFIPSQFAAGATFPPPTHTHTIISIPRLHSVRVAPQPAARIPAVIDSWETPHHHSSTSVMFRLLLSPPPLFFFWWSLSCRGGRGPPQGRFHPSAQETKAPQFNTNERWCVCARACGIFMYKAAALRNCQRQIEDKV